MTPEEVRAFWKTVDKYRFQGHRMGQAMMNALYDVAPELYGDVTGHVYYDCFYQDGKIPAFSYYLGI